MDWTALQKIPAKRETHPVLKRFLNRLIRDVYRAGEPSNGNEIFYDAKIKLSSKSISAIHSFLKDADSSSTGPLDDALSGILVDITRTRMSLLTSPELMDGGDRGLILAVGCSFIFGLLIFLIKDQLRVSWFKMFSTLFYFSFFVSIPWNWMYLYKEAFAKHRNSIIRMEKLNERCMGLKDIGWYENLFGWYGSYFTVQDDPCEEILKVILIDPLLLVPPLKVFSYTITSCIKEPLKPLGEGLGEFFRALLKDLPIISWIPVLIIVLLCFLIPLSGGISRVFQLFVRRMIPFGGLLLPENAQRQDDDVRLEQNAVNQTQPGRAMEEPPIECLNSADLSSEEPREAAGNQGGSENQPEVKKERLVTTPDQPEANQTILVVVESKQINTQRKGCYDEPYRRRPTPTHQPIEMHHGWIRSEALPGEERSLPSLRFMEAEIASAQQTSAVPLD